MSIARSWPLLTPMIGVNSHCDSGQETWLTSGAHSSKSDGPMMWLFSESTEMGLSPGAGPIIIAPCVLALQALESDHLETLQARPDFTAFSHKDGSSLNCLDS